ncbi:TPA: bifunctional (p)ppGpp synthetase/guanosine-3',5'-bis(diphosphate) 3'-pyrophosphohydrolase, partial [bacterium]|nr:bifunctional (p)ppGpp synthetase/guanosine-3',5'-bis(diphosphate) 3'-pyrophosphohydrolase [bacterium]
MSLKQTIENSVIETDATWLINEIKAYDSELDANMIRSAYNFSMLKHDGQLRKSGEPYFLHCQETARILASWGMDYSTITAGLLHDVLEDTDTKPSEIKELFGQEITQMVEGVTKINKISFMDIENQAESLRKMILAISKDIRVILIKLADRLHNMRTLEYINKDSQQKKAQETLEIYAQLAHRLGMERVSAELKNLSMMYLDRATYDKISDQVNREIKIRRSQIDEFSKILRDSLLEVEIQCEVEGRLKDIYSIYQKMTTRGIQFENVYDLFAFRVLVNSVNDCYASLGIIHSKWKPIPGRIKDYIAMPKTNGYQSLHTTVIGPRGKPIEIQIRTFEMHTVAEYGIAAHWKYKEGGSWSEEDKRFMWLRQIVEDMQELRNPRHFMESVKSELFPEEVYVFTPKGEVKVLPHGATPIDFAFSVHTEVGFQAVGAKVNGASVPLRNELKSGDIVEITTRSGAKPSKDWLKFVKSTRARSKIRHWIREQERSESLKLGHDLLMSELQSRRINTKGIMKSDGLLNVAQQLKLSSTEDLIAHIGYGKVSVQHVVNLYAPETIEEKSTEIEPETIPHHPSGGVKVGGVGQPFVRFAKCCNPIPGDDIVGFITRGRGVTIHVADCKEILGESERILDAEWDIQQDAVYPVEILIESDNKKGLLADLAAAIAKEGVNIESGSISTENMMAETNFTIQVSDLAHLRKVAD